MKNYETRGLLFLGLELQERRKKLDGSSSPLFLLLLGLFSTSKNPFARARAGHEGLRGCYNVGPYRRQKILSLYVHKWIKDC
ncbi:hypothetical protein Taro_024910 [Colocasia esculenta]|uniref:Uncharacterized protein n=1 Tax=Colocasia esculenta TaxID=4460 RepID=A0A843V822_COLES|nr:hypothetical protein [Colocasia esculenta]